MHSSAEFERMPKRNYGLRDWDYRNMYYRQPRYQAHPSDCSVMTYRGHAVLKTLIRCHFSPPDTTGQQYVYSGSADGKIHIWSLDGQVVQVLDRALARPLHADDGGAADPSAPHAADTTPSRLYCTVRDVSWHKAEPAIMSTAWDGRDFEQGSIAKHELASANKTRGMYLQDAVATDQLQALG